MGFYFISTLIDILFCCRFIFVHIYCPRLGRSLITHLLSLRGVWLHASCVRPTPVIVFAKEQIFVCYSIVLETSTVVGGVHQRLAHWCINGNQDIETIFLSCTLQAKGVYLTAISHLPESRSLPSKCITVFEKGHICVGLLSAQKWHTLLAGISEL